MVVFDAAGALRLLTGRVLPHAQNVKTLRDIACYLFLLLATAQSVLLAAPYWPPVHSGRPGYTCMYASMWFHHALTLVGGE